MSDSGFRKSMAWAGSVCQDVRYGLRVLRKDAAATAVAILSLSVAIGACTAAFALIDALILRPLPVRDPGSLVYGINRTVDGEESEYFSYPMFERLRDTSSEHVQLFAMAYQTKEQIVVEQGGSQAEWVYPHAISGEALSVLGVTPAIGRLLSRTDDQPGRSPVAVLSDAYWERRFARNPAVLGQLITYRGVRLEIVGVAAAGFNGVEPGFFTDVWVPITAVRGDQVANPNSTWLRMWGRLQNRTSARQAEAVLQAGAIAFRRDLAPRATQPDDLDTHIQQRVDLVSAANGPSRIRDRFEKPLWTLGGVAALVLLIACGNVASLLVARAGSRGREMAVRVAVGASRGRLVQQVLVESALLSVAACALGAFIAMRAASLVVRLLSTSQVPLTIDTAVDWRVLGFVAAVGCATTLLFGILPAWRAASTAPHQPLTAVAQRYTPRRGVFRPLVIGQIAFGFTVLSVGWLLGASFVRLVDTDLGFASENLTLVTVDANGVQREPVTALAAFEGLLRRLKELPEVQAVSASEYALFEGPRSGVDVVLPSSGDVTIEPSYLLIGPGFLQTMGIPLQEGREFEWSDARSDASPAAIVNESFARRVFPNGSAVGRQLSRGRQGGRIEIVGVARDARYGSLREPPPPTLYAPLVPRRYMTIQIRTTTPVGALGPTVRDEVARAHPAFRVTEITDQAALIANTLVQERVLAVLAVVFSGLAIVLVAGGVYGVLSYGVGQRRREFGLRLALGATPGGIVGLVLREVTGLLAVGVLLGMAGTLAASRFAASLLYEVRQSDAQSVAIPFVSLLTVCMLSATIPAIRAMRIDPATTLRDE